MKKDRFLGYLDHMRQMAKEHYYSEEVEDVVELLDEIIAIAEQLDEPTKRDPGLGVPVYPPAQYPPNTIWLDETYSWQPPSDSEVDITDAFCYNSKLPDPNEWSVKKDSKLPSNWKIIK